MRISARLRTFARSFLFTILSLGLGLGVFLGAATPVQAQVPSPTQTTNNTSYSDYKNPDVDANVPVNHHSYAQIVVIDVMSALVCQMVGIDPTNPKQPCLGVNPLTNKIGTPPEQMQQFGQVSPQQPQLGGAMGMMGDMITTMYVPTVSSTQYSQYLASNFGIVKQAEASGQQQPSKNCAQDTQFGYGFCGLQPIFMLWVTARDFAYSLLVLAFVFLGLGIMLRFKADPRAVMTLQNQIPRVIIAILLITFSYAIAGVMVDLMWTATYAGVNVISSSRPNAKVGEGCGGPNDGKSVQEVATNNLLDNPFSYADKLLLGHCEPDSIDSLIESGVGSVSTQIKDSFITLVISVLNDFLGWDDGESCSEWILDSLGECFQAFGTWITGLILTLIIFVAILIALFRLWFELIKAYISFFIFVVLGPVWIVFGLLPGRPLGFEKWFRLIFANLAAFPLVAFILVFGRVLIDSVPANPDPNSVFIAPLVGNPKATTFNSLMAYGAVLIAPMIPAMIRERMKSGQGKFGQAIAGGTKVGTGVVTNPAAKKWEKWNRHDSAGKPIGALARKRQSLRTAAWDKSERAPVIGKPIKKVRNWINS